MNKHITAFFKQLFCRHKTCKTLYICYQDRYVEKQCIKCRKIIFESL